MRLTAPLTLVLLVAALTGCLTTSSQVRVGRVLPVEGGAVVSVDPLASRIGGEVLARGGSAVDAAVATALALAVTWPEAGNLGGGGFMLVRQSEGSAVFIDYREKAPLLARPDMFLNEAGVVDPVKERLGYLPVGVPGTVAGLFRAHQEFGRLPWRELVLPAVELAEGGFEIGPALEKSLASAAKELARCEEARAIFFDEQGQPLAKGALLVQADLGRSLRLIAEQGRDAFYAGPIAEMVVSDSGERGGLLSREDFARYEAVMREPLRGSYRGFEILAGPPPTSGGTVLLESLNQLEQFDLASLPAGSAAELHLLAEAQRRSFLDRARFLGDPDFVRNPLDRLLDKSYGRLLGSGIDLTRATPSDTLALDLDGTLPPPESEQTTHFSVIDADGNAVSNTYTLEESWGARTVARGTGILLNNQMHDFNVDPGRSTRKGRIGTVPNTIRPEKRMLSSMCPVILTRQGRPYLVAGSPGGRSIPSTVLRVVTGMVDHALSPAHAVELSRVHHGLYPDLLLIEQSSGAEVMSRLAELGHTLKKTERQGDCHAIGWDPETGGLQAAADDRLNGGATTTR
ncbi:MAG: gamma-glutamyltransferase [Planctomycetota bacterium]